MDDQVPAVCGSCLGDNPYLRMIRENGGELCNMCQRPYAKFRWVPQRGQPYKKTVICKSCSKIKNCCQSCMLDLSYGLPIAIRDEALKMVSNKTAVEGSTDRTKLYAIEQQERDYEDQQEDDTSERARDLLKRLASATASGNTSSKIDHPKEGNQERRYDDNSKNKDDGHPGVNVDVEKLAQKLPFNGSMTIPKDSKLCSFFIYGIDEEVSEADIRNHLSEMAGSGGIKSMQIVHRAKCGFVTFSDRSGAEKAASRLTDGMFVVKGCKLRCAWGKPRALGSSHVNQLELAKVVRRAIKGKLRKTKGKVSTLKKGSVSTQAEVKQPEVAQSASAFEL